MFDDHFIIGVQPLSNAYLTNSINTKQNTMRMPVLQKTNMNHVGAVQQTLTVGKLNTNAVTFINKVPDCIQQKILTCLHVFLLICLLTHLLRSLIVFRPRFVSQRSINSLLPSRSSVSQLLLFVTLLTSNIPPLFPTIAALGLLPSSVDALDSRGTTTGLLVDQPPMISLSNPLWQDGGLTHPSIVSRRC